MIQCHGKVRFVTQNFSDGAGQAIAWTMFDKYSNTIAPGHIYNPGEINGLQRLPG